MRDMRAECVSGVSTCMSDISLHCLREMGRECMSGMGIQCMRDESMSVY